MGFFKNLIVGKAANNSHQKLCPDLDASPKKSPVYRLLGEGHHPDVLFRNEFLSHKLVEDVKNKYTNKDKMRDAHNGLADLASLIRMCPENHDDHVVASIRHDIKVYTRLWNTAEGCKDQDTIYRMESDLESIFDHLISQFEPYMAHVLFHVSDIPSDELHVSFQVSSLMMASSYISSGIWIGSGGLPIRFNK